jgi:hypothetical protein
MLEMLNGLENADGLIVLVVEQAKRLRQIDSLHGLAQLGTLVLNDCPKIESIRSLADLSSLETVGLMQTTNVADGDFSPLLTLPKLRNATFVDRPHYSHRNESFPKDQEAFY